VAVGGDEFVGEGFHEGQDGSAGGQGSGYGQVGLKDVGVLEG
jgi:hypothetical protein